MLVVRYRLLYLENPSFLSAAVVCHCPILFDPPFYLIGLLLFLLDYVINVSDLPQYNNMHNSYYHYWCMVVN